MVHGFGGGGAIYCRMLSILREYFHCITIDMLGQGASGRPDYNCFTFETAMDFHLDSINAWMESKLIGHKYYLLGHSLGACIACHYALRHPKDIIRLILMSPVGVAEIPEHLEYKVV